MWPRQSEAIEAGLVTQWAPPLRQRRNLTVNQNSLILSQENFDGLFAGKRGGGPLGFAFDQLVMDQVLAHQADFELGIHHSPDLTTFQLFRRDSALLTHGRQNDRAREKKQSKTEINSTPFAWTAGAGSL